MHSCIMRQKSSFRYTHDQNDHNDCNDCCDGCIEQAAALILSVMSGSREQEIRSETCSLARAQVQHKRLTVFLSGQPHVLLVRRDTFFQLIVRDCA